MIKLMNIYTSLSTYLCDRYVKRNGATAQTDVKKKKLLRNAHEGKNKHFALV